MCPALAGRRAPATATTLERRPCIGGALVQGPVHPLPRQGARRGARRGAREWGTSLSACPNAIADKARVAAAVRQLCGSCAAAVRTQLLAPRMMRGRCRCGLTTCHFLVASLLECTRRAVLRGMRLLPPEAPLPPFSLPLSSEGGRVPAMHGRACAGITHTRTSTHSMKKKQCTSTAYHYSVKRLRPPREPLLLPTPKLSQQGSSV